MTTDRGYYISDQDKMVYFTYAHHLSVLRAASGPATDNRPLGEFLAGRV